MLKFINYEDYLKEGITVTEQFTMIILLIALGYFLKRINFIKATDGQSLLVEAS